jgi:hypothetical protein
MRICFMCIIWGNYLGHDLLVLILTGYKLDKKPEIR